MYKTQISLLLVIVLCSSVVYAGNVSVVHSAPRAQLFSGLGPHRRTITTDSRETQAYFDQGLTWMYACNHDEAIRSFKHAG
jgi:hypothetical protein